MRIGIIAAMSKELDLLLRMMDNVTEYDAGGMRVYEGRIGNHDVVATKCGIGKVNSAIGTYKFIRNEHPDVLINSGVAGSGDASMPVGSILVADSFAYHDVWCGPGTEYGAADGFPAIMLSDSHIVDTARHALGKDRVRFGLICSGDKFMTTADQLDAVKQKFPDALAVDMESASIGQVCAMENVPFCVIRAISDRPGSSDNCTEYSNFWNDAPLHIVEVVRAIIENIE